MELLSFARGQNYYISTERKISDLIIGVLCVMIGLPLLFFLSPLLPMPGWLLIAMSIGLLAASAIAAIIWSRKWLAMGAVLAMVLLYLLIVLFVGPMH
jgi:hypothetical protein